MNLKYGPYSPSRLETATCGLSFQHQYGPGSKDRPRISSLPAERGSAMHEIHEHITKRLCENPDAVFTKTELQGVVATAVSHFPGAYAEAKALLDMALLYVQRPPAVLTSDAGIELRLAIKMVDGVFEQCDYDDPEAWFRGRADILVISDDTTVAIVYDHKTQPNIEDADTFQMGFYAWVISKIYPFLSEIRTVLHFSRYGRYSEPFVWTKDDLAAIEDDIMTRVQIIEGRQSWEATPHKGCMYCPLLGECPAVASLIQRDEHTGTWSVRPGSLSILGQTGKAVEVAGLINVMEEVVKRLKAELKEYVQQSGAPIAIPGRVYGFWAGNPKVNWDVVNKSLRAQTYAIFEKYNLDPKLFMGFSQTFSPGVWKLSNEELLKELTALFPTEVETKFEGKKA